MQTRGLDFLLWFLVIIFSCVTGWSESVAGGAENDIDFSHQVSPILRQHCVECHGGGQAKGGFSLDTRSLLLESGAVELGEPADSLLIELVESADPDWQMPPSDKPRLSAEDIEVLKEWIRQGGKWEAGFSFAANRYEPPLFPRQVPLPRPNKTNPQHPIDRLIDDYFEDHDVAWPEPAGDRAFMRRVSLDLIGLLPTPAELDAFVRDASADKRERLVRRLLEDRFGYTEHWLSFFNDLLRNDYSGTGFITGGRKQISGWLYAALLQNMPFDQFARELISPPTDASRGYISGIKWRGSVSAGQTREIQFAQSISQSFLGINLKCASCHDSFIDRWTLKDAYGLAAIYADQRLELHRCDKPTGEMAEPSWLFPELGEIDPTADRGERLEQLANLMTHPRNGRFTRTIVNRLWQRMMGRGIVHPLDAMQTEPWSADLLDYLATRFAEDGYDLKKLLELIATSDIYAAQVQTAEQMDAAAYVFRGPQAKRLTAEQFMDATWQLTGAAPSDYDAPVERAWVSKDRARSVTLQARWIWARLDKLRNPTSLPSVPGGQKVTLHKQFTLEAAAQSASVVLTADNKFTLFINDHQVADGDDWTQVQRVDVTGALGKGVNNIFVVCENGGESSNPAGLLFEMHVDLPKADSLVIASSDNWSASLESLESMRVKKDRIVQRPAAWDTTAAWRAAVELPDNNPWDQHVKSAFQRQVVLAQQSPKRMVRASLMKNNALMRSLGRPMREQIVSMRPNRLTTLEAIDLANKEDVFKAFRLGAESLVSRFGGNTEAIADHLFRFALSRQVTKEESNVIAATYGPEMSVNQVQDLLWSICMLPEFMFVR